MFLCEGGFSGCAFVCHSLGANSPGFAYRERSKMRAPTQRSSHAH